MSGMEHPASSVLHYHRWDSERASGGAFKTSGSLPNMTFEEYEGFLRFQEKYPEMNSLMDIDAKRAFVHGKRAEMRLEMQALQAEVDSIVRKKRLDYLNGHISAYRGLEAWVNCPLKIERPEGISFRRLRKDVAEGRTIYLDRDIDAETPAHDFEKEVFRFAEVMVVEHDWAGAMLTADLGDAPVKLPYDVCAFEFRFSGRTVIALATQLETDIAFSPAILCDEKWFLAGFVAPATGYGDDDGGWLTFFNILGAQIRAICVALDAKVAISDTVREPYSSAPGRNAHRPLKPYHVVSLANRGPRPAPSIGESGRHIRLHFRRGHWRHFENHKTWIKWMLVGDPDLGFVNKHYRL